MSNCSCHALELARVCRAQAEGSAIGDDEGDGEGKQTKRRRKGDGAEGSGSRSRGSARDKKDGAKKAPTDRKATFLFV